MNCTIRCERLDVVVAPDPEILRADAPLGGDGRRFGEHERRAADGAAAQVDQMPVVGEAVGARVLTHGRDERAVRERQAAQRQRVEEMRHVVYCAARPVRHAEWA